MDNHLVVVDTSALVSFFQEVFNQPRKLSTRAMRIIQDALDDYSSTRMSIPSIVFVELFEKWARSEEKQAQIRALVFEYLAAAPNVEIRPLDREVIENLMVLRMTEPDLDNHDMIILASAKSLNATIITTDRKLIALAARERMKHIS